VSIPRFTSPNRGRSPVPKFSSVSLPQHSSSVARTSSFERADSPDLIFPMSPVLESKEAALNFSPRRVHPLQQAKRNAPEPILIDLVFQQAQSIHLPQKEMSNLKTRSKISSAQTTNPSTQQKLRRQASSGITRRLVQFLNPTLPSVMATPTAVTVRRSSQADGLTEFVMEEHTRPPLSDRPVSKPVQIKRLKDQEQRDLSQLSFDDDDEPPASLPKQLVDQLDRLNHEHRTSNDSIMVAATRPRRRLSLKNFASHAHLRSTQCQ